MNRTCQYPLLKDRAWLERTRQELSRREISEKLHCCLATVNYWLRAHGFSRLPTSCWARRETRVKLLSEKAKGNTNGLGHVFPQKLKDRFSIERTGVGNPSWKGGRSYTSSKRTGLAGWRRLAAKIRERDNFRCQRCGKSGYSVHHVVPWEWTHNDDESNLSTLCRSCHRKVDAVLQICLN